MIKTFKASIMLLVVLFLGSSSCDKPKNVDSVVEKTPVITPCKVQGIAPENGAPCADVKAVSEEPSKVSILFQWTSSEFADGYELHVFEPPNEIFSKILTSLEATVTLDRGKSYSWSITAKNGNAEITSNTFSFTTPGEAMGNYVPYAAAITVAFDAMTSDMNIFWTGCDEDGDTLTYDIIIKENETLLAEFSDLSVESLDALPFVPSSVYSIEVTSKDNFGNFFISKHYEIAPN